MSISLKIEDESDSEAKPDYIYIRPFNSENMVACIFLATFRRGVHIQSLYNDGEDLDDKYVKIIDHLKDNFLNIVKDAAPENIAYLATFIINYNLYDFPILD